MNDTSDAAASGNPSNQKPTSDGPTLVEADPERGFNYPYYLAVPEGIDEQRPILVEPHNVGEQVEAFERHLELARQRIENRSGRYIADELGAPMLVPVFPRPSEEPALLKPSTSDSSRRVG